MHKIPTIEEMLKAGLHFGHRTSKWHPKMEPFIFGSRNGIHIIDLVKTQEMIKKSLEFIKKNVRENKVILFVGTKDQVKDSIKKVAEENNMPYVSEKWISGLITNFNIIRKNIKKFKDLTEQKNSGKLEKYTKKERLDFDREIAKLNLKVGGLVNLTKNPDALFIWDVKRENTALTEAMKKKIPIIAVCDTNINPQGIDYIIPANDDASKGVKLLMNSVNEAIKDAKTNKN